MVEPRVKLRFAIDHGNWAANLLDKCDYEIVYLDPNLYSYDQRWVVRVFRKGNEWLELWCDEDFSNKTLIEL